VCPLPASPPHPFPESKSAFRQEYAGFWLDGFAVEIHLEGFSMKVNEVRLVPFSKNGRKEFDAEPLIPDPLIQLIHPLIPLIPDVETNIHGGCTCFAFCFWWVV
jgi:hypothetical protein